MAVALERLPLLFVGYAGVDHRLLVVTCGSDAMALRFRHIGSRTLNFLTPQVYSCHRGIDTDISLRITLIHMLEYRRALLLVERRRVGAGQSSIERVFDGQL